MRYSKEKIDQMVNEAIEKQRPLTLVTYYLSEYGEMVLNTIALTLLERFGRSDLNDIMYTAVKELVMNAAKANLKRAIIKDQLLDPDVPEDYEKVMRIFKENLSEKRIKNFRPKFKKHGMPVTVTFYFEKDKVIYMKVKNAFQLLPQEEERVREKFRQAKNFNDLMEFYMAHGDNTEGAGMGITLVEILMAQSGFDRHLFVIYSSERYNETIARLEVPLSDSHITRRQRFERDLAANGTSPEVLRENYRLK